MESILSNELETLEIKKIEAEKAIKYYVAGATATGAIPIPVADATILMAGQIKMILHILKIYGIKETMTKETLYSLFLQRIVTQGGKYLSKYLARKLTFVAGAAINASVAGAVTYTLGKGISEAAYIIRKKTLLGDKDIEKFENIKKIIDNVIEKSFVSFGDLGEVILEKVVLKKKKIKVR